MKNTVKNVLLGIWLLSGILSVYADESKGYKIILSSFKTLEEANNSMHTLGSRIGSDEAEMQKKYGYEIVARASGKAFIIAIEPLSSQESAEKVKQGFVKFYPSSYINGYFGPTEGAIVLLPKNESAAKITEPSRNEIAQTSNEPPVSAEQSTVVEHSDQKFPWLWSIFGIIVAVIMASVWYRYKRPSIKKTGTSENNIEAVDLSVKEEDSNTIGVFSRTKTDAEATDSTPSLDSHNVPNKDIFYKLQKNIFFKTLLDELKKAAQLKNEQRCIEVMEEIFRYQKNFRQSEKITSLQQCIENKEFDKLVELIEIA